MTEKTYETTQEEFAKGMGQQIAEFDEKVKDLLERISKMSPEEKEQLIKKIGQSAKGFVKDTSGNPDFLIRYIASGSVQHDIPQTYYPGSPPSLTHAGSVGTFMMGAVQIEVINPETNNLMWQGYGETPITGDGTRTTKLTRALKKILRDFPPS